MSRRTLAQAVVETVTGKKDEEDKAAKPEKPKPRTCQMNLVIDVTVDLLLQQQPENPTIRAHVMSRIKQPVPEELKTYDEIKEWVETTIVPSKTIEVTKQDNPVALRIGVEWSQRISGRASFTAREFGSGELRIRASDVIRLSGNCDSFNDLSDAINDLIVEQAINAVDIDTDDHRYQIEETTDSDDSDTDYNVTQMRAELSAWMMNNMRGTMEEWGEA